MVMHLMREGEFEASLEFGSSLRLTKVKLGRADTVQGVDEHLGKAEPLRQVERTVAPSNSLVEVLREHVQLRHRAVGHGELGTRRELFEHLNGFHRKISRLLASTAKPVESRQPAQVVAGPEQVALLPPEPKRRLAQ